MRTGERAPCLGCERRTTGCHGKCTDYQEWLLRRRKRYFAEKAQREVQDYEARNVFFRQEGSRKR